MVAFWSHFCTSHLAATTYVISSQPHGLNFEISVKFLIQDCRETLGQFPWRNYSAADSAWVRLGPSRSAADAGGVRQIQFRRGTKNSAAESAADSADCRGTNLFRRGSDRIRGGLAELPPAECTEKGPRESATRIFRECPPRTFEKFRLRGTIPRLTTVPRNHSAANNRVAEPFRG